MSMLGFPPILVVSDTVVKCGGIISLSPSHKDYKIDQLFAGTYILLYICIK